MSGTLQRIRDRQNFSLKILKFVRKKPQPNRQAGKKQEQCDKRRGLWLWASGKGMGVASGTRRAS